MRKLKVTILPSEADIQKSAEEMRKFNSRSKSPLSSGKKQREFYVTVIKENLPKIGDIVSLHNAQFHWRSLNVWAGWKGSWKYGNMYCLDMHDGEISIGTVQSVGHK